LEQHGKFETAAAELGAVVSDTEQATNGIMNNVERIEDIIGEVLAVLPAGFGATRLIDARDHIVKIYEACNFQDITGQRINKVVRHHLLHRGARHRDAGAVERERACHHADGAASRPHGWRARADRPVSAGGSESVSQDDIDALFR